MNSNDRLRAQHSLLITLDRRLHHRRMDQFRPPVERQLLLLFRVRLPPSPAPATPSQHQHPITNDNDNDTNSPGNKYTSALGALYLNATLTLLQQGPSSSGPLFFNLYYSPSFPQFPLPPSIPLH